jgi:hypothetical protein
VPPVGGDAAQHGVGEVGLAPAADAVGGVGRDVRGGEAPEGGDELAAAAEAQAVLALGLRRGVAGGAAAGPEPGLAAPGVARGKSSELGRRQPAGDGQDEEAGRGGGSERQERGEQASHAGRA